MHNISRILCQNFKSIGAKLTTLWVFLYLSDFYTCPARACYCYLEQKGAKKY